MSAVKKGQSFVIEGLCAHAHSVYRQVLQGLGKLLRYVIRVAFQGDFSILADGIGILQLLKDLLE